MSFLALVKRPIGWISLSLAVITLIGFQNCSQNGSSGSSPQQSIAETSNSSTSTSTSTLVAQEAQQTLTSAAKTTCPTLEQYKNAQADAAVELQKCFDASKNKTLEIPAGVYSISKPLLIQGPINIITAGKNVQSAPCTQDDASCVTLRSVGDIPKPTTGRRGTIHLNGPSIIISHVIFDGNRQNRLNSLNHQRCADSKNPDNSYGWETTVDGDSVTVMNGVLKNAICGTSMEVHASTTKFQLIQNIVANNGRHYQNNLWSDGITVHDSTNSVFTDNTFIDNTDVQLVFGGCQKCTVARNKFFHTTENDGASFCEIMIQAWPGGPGNYTSSVFSNNDLDCGEARNCGYGILIGGDPWYLTTKAFNGVVTQNNIKRAMIGLSLDDVTGSFQVVKNNITDILDGEYKCQNDPSKTARTSLYNIAPASLQLVTDDTKNEFYAYQKQWGSTAVTSRDNDLCIPQPPYVWSKPFTTDSPAVIFVKALYQNLLNREADAGGLSFHVNDLSVVGARQVALNFFASDEVRINLLEKATTEDFINRVYRAILVRDPDAGGLAYYTKVINEGAITRMNVVYSLLDSDEFKASCQQKGIKY